MGLYAVLRTFTLIFAYDPGFTHPWIAGMGSAAMILGGIGAIAYTDIPRILNYNVIISVGFVALGLAAATPDALDGAVFYLMHDMLSKGLMYMLGGIIIMLAGSEKLGDMGGMLRRYPLIGWMFLVLALAVAGIPPLSGFAGKVLIIRGALDQGMLTLSLIGLASSFLVLYSLIKIFMLAFWRNEPAREYPKVQTQGATAAAAGLLAIVIAMGIGSEIVYEYVAEAGAVMAHPQAYIEAVLKE
ncbi:Na(+)/H(+) antiporter subunit D [compost metagenome]